MTDKMTDENGQSAGFDTSKLDPRTNRPYGDHGTAMQAITFCLEVLQVERDTFLKCWSEGDLDEWPEFYVWLLKQPPETGLSTGAEPVAWMDDGSTRSGSETTSFRVVSAETKSAMPKASAMNFNTPLYAAKLKEKPSWRDPTIFDDTEGRN